VRAGTSLVRFLDELFTMIDTLLDQHDGCLVKIKTIGDSYFAVAGLSSREKNNGVPISTLRESMKR
jgi:class 3 adenylate cyclase